MDVSKRNKWQMHYGPASSNGEVFLREISVDAKLFGTGTQSQLAQLHQAFSVEEVYNTVDRWAR
jgi:hypothetical protein